MMVVVRLSGVASVGGRFICGRTDWILCAMKVSLTSEVMIELFPQPGEVSQEFKREMVKRNQASPSSPQTAIRTTLVVNLATFNRTRVASVTCSH